MNFEVPWDEAIEIAAEISRVKEKFGNQSIWRFLWLV